MLHGNLDKKFALIFSTIIVLFLLIVTPRISNATATGYMTGTENPWGNTTNNAAMNRTFGTGNWDLYQGFTASAFSDTTEFLYLDGGDGQAIEFVNFLGANITSIESWVSAGGSLFLNAATWYYTNSTFSVGFGITSTESYSGMGSASATGTHTIFDASTGTSWTGNHFAHNYLTGTGLTDLIVNGNGQTILAEMDYGLGHVIFGGLTTTNYQYPNLQSENLRDNILAYGATAAEHPVPEPGSLILLGSGCLIIAGYRRTRRTAP